MAHFDEKSGVVPCLTPWGKWYQTMEEIFIEVNAPEGTTSKMVKVIFGSKQLACTVRGEELIKVCACQPRPAPNPCLLLNRNSCTKFM